VSRSPEAWALRCPSCRRLIRARALDAPGGDRRAYEVEVVGHRETRRRIDLPWTAADARRLRQWLVWSTLLTLGLVAVLLAAAHLAAR
jgi:hypothetical protein